MDDNEGSLDDGDEDDTNHKNNNKTNNNKNIKDDDDDEDNVNECIIVTDSGDGDIDQLQEVVDILKPHVTPLEDIDILSTKITDIKLLLPILMSVAYYHLAYSSIELYLSSRHMTSSEAYNAAEHVMAIQKQITLSLQYFPWNAAMWSMGANFGRMSETMEPELVCQWYQCAAECASHVRTCALNLLLEGIKNINDNDDAEKCNDDDDDKSETIGEWIEDLLLQQVAGVEWIEDEKEDDDDDDDDSEMEDNVTGAKHQKSKGEADDDNQVIIQDKDDGHASFSMVESTARFMAAMLHSTAGRHDKALEHLKHFSLTHRLHPNVWRGKTEPQQVSSDETKKQKTTPVSPPPHVWTTPTCFAPSVLPPHLYQRMCQLFAPDADYWRESDYGNRGYFSYFMNLESDQSSSKPPQNLIEEVIVQHLLPMAQQVLSSADTATTTTDTIEATSPPSIVGAEWWVHTRPIQANLGHNLHFDTEESCLDQTGQITHPILSSVLYLTGNDDNHHKHHHSPAGATIVLDQTPDSQQVAKVCWRNVPRDNTFLVFPGNLLHGVLPCPGAAAGAVKEDRSEVDDGDDSTTATANNNKSKGDAMLSLLRRWNANNKSVTPSSSPTSTNRLTFMVGFWTRRIPDPTKEQKVYGPCGPLPLDAKWVQEIRQGYYDQDHDSSNSKNINKSNKWTIPQQESVPHISLAWQDIPPLKGKQNDDDDNVITSHPLLQIPKAIDHRFFVSNAPQCFRDSLFEKDEADN